jgi:hypothetical protein
MYQKTASDQRDDVEAFVEEYDLILRSVATHVLNVINSALDQNAP